LQEAVYNADCEAELQLDGSRKQFEFPTGTLTQDIVYESLINIRPPKSSDGNFMPGFKEQVAQVIQQLLGGEADDERQDYSR